MWLRPLVTSQPMRGRETRAKVVWEASISPTDVCQSFDEQRQATKCQHTSLTTLWIVHSSWLPIHDESCFGFHFEH